MATPDFSNPLPGNLYRIERSAGGDPETFAFLCLANTRELEMEKELEKFPAMDCANPTAIPAERSTVKMTRWGASMSGTVDADRFALIRADAEASVSRRYRFVIDKLLADGGGAWIGAAHLSKLTVTSQENGVVKFTATLTGDGPLLWADAAA